MSDLADTPDPTAPLERVADMDEPERTNTALAIAARALRVAAYVMATSGKETVMVPEEMLQQIPVDALYIGKACDGVIPVLLSL